MNSRQKNILDQLRAKGNCDVKSLAQHIKVSEITIRRELQTLEQKGLIIRNHGGAILSEKVTFDFSYMQRTQVNRAAKEAIADMAVEQMGKARVVMLDSATSTLALANQLRMHTGLTLMTTSLPVVSTLQHCAGIELLLLGGIMRRDRPDLYGPLTELYLESLYADVAFIGADAIDDKGGVFNNSMAIGCMLRKMASRAERVYVLADSSKLGKTGLMCFGQLEKWAALITDEHADKSQLRALKNAGCKVIVAPVRERA